MNTNFVVMQLAHEAQYSDDPKRCWEIVEALNKLGAWEAAALVAALALALERQLAAVNG